MALLKIPQGCLSSCGTLFCLTVFAQRYVPHNDVILVFVFQHAWSNWTMPPSQGPAKSCSCLLSSHLFMLWGIYQQVSMNSQPTTCYLLPNPWHLWTWLVLAWVWVRESMCSFSLCSLLVLHVGVLVNHMRVFVDMWLYLLHSLSSNTWKMLDLHSLVLTAACFEAVSVAIC